MPLNLTLYQNKDYPTAQITIENKVLTLSLNKIRRDTTDLTHHPLVVFFDGTLSRLFSDVELQTKSNKISFTVDGLFSETILDGLAAHFNDEVQHGSSLEGYVSRECLEQLAKECKDYIKQQADLERKKTPTFSPRRSFAIPIPKKELKHNDTDGFRTKPINETVRASKKYLFQFVGQYWGQQGEIIFTDKKLIFSFYPLNSSKQSEKITVAYGKAFADSCSHFLTKNIADLLENDSDSDDSSDEDDVPNPNQKQIGNNFQITYTFKNKITQKDFECILGQIEKFPAEHIIEDSLVTLKAECHAHFSKKSYEQSHRLRFLAQKHPPAKKETTLPTAVPRRFSPGGKGL